MKQDNVSGSPQQLLLGLRIGAGPLDSVVERALHSVDKHGACFKFACANPHSLVAAQNDAEFLRALRHCDATVADGIGVTLVARLAGVHVGPRITGHDFFSRMMASLDRRGGRAFFFGSSDSVLSAIAARAACDYPHVIVESLSPPYGAWSKEQNEAMVAHIRARAPDVLWVGMTAPRQEKWVAENAARLGVPVIGSIGAVFDYYAGTVRRAPRWLCRLGLEWAYRLAHEPVRLWRRTLVSAPMFLALVLRERLRLALAGRA